MKLMWIKVCGIRETSTAIRVAEFGINAIGLNFFAKSPRAVTVNEASKISDHLPANVARVGVFVNHSIAEVTSISRQCRLNYAQLHGDESPAFFVELQDKLPEIRLIRAWRMKGDGLTELSRFLAECDRHKVGIAACLVDAHVDGIYGGSGKTVPWDQLESEYDRKNWPPLILAGGLNPANVNQAIAASNPWGVDVASGVETSPGNKDLELVRQFVSACKS